MLKRNTAELAILGAAPLFSKTRVVNRPFKPPKSDLLCEISEIIDSHRYTNDGSRVKRLEARIAEFLNVKHCVAVVNGTIGIQLAMAALEVRGKVILPAFTFIATAHALRWNGIEPIFCDLDPATHNLDPRACERLITSHTKAILPVHLWGRPCDTEAFEHLARSRGVALVFDAAHAFGVTHAGRSIGTFGDAEVFSFHATKSFHTFEGGAIVTENDQLANRLREMRNFGFQDFDRVIDLGINAKMHEITAAIGLANLDCLQSTWQLNQRVYEAYGEGLDAVSGLKMLRFDQAERQNFHYIVVEVDDAFGLSRDELVEVLSHERIAARRYFTPGCHRSEPYAHAMKRALPHTDAKSERVIVLPGGSSVTDSEAIQICRRLASVGAHAERIASHLSRHSRNSRKGQ